MRVAACRCGLMPSNVDGLDVYGLCKEVQTALVGGREVQMDGVLIGQRRLAADDWPVVDPNVGFVSGKWIDTLA